MPLAVAILAFLGLSGCASSGTAHPSPFPRPGDAAEEPFAAALAALLDTALAQRGVPYRPGGADPSGFDCSGLVAYVLAQHGVWMPRTAAEQFHVGRGVRRRAIRPGDLVFFTTVARGPSHVGIAVSAHEFVHAPSSAGVVRIEDMRAAYWARRFVGARRLPAVFAGRP